MQDPDLPASFFLGGGISGGWAGPGYVKVAPGRLSYQASAPLARLSRVQGVTHEGSRVTVVRARMLPPGLNTAILIVGQGRFVRVLAWYGRSRPLLRALTAAGFVLDERQTSFSLGWRIGKESLRPG